MNFFKCLIYLAIVSFGSFLFGRILPKNKFDYAKFPYRQMKFEQSGRIYKVLGVRQWKGKAIDMSIFFAWLMPSKKVPEKVTARHAELMLQETCVAEFIHHILAILGFGCVFIWENIGGWIVSLLYAVGNIPYIIIQRYNRPKLITLLTRLKKGAGTKCTDHTKH